jgi:hypothetical protein
MSMLGLVLLYVGAVLIINGLSMLGKISAREAAVMNIFTGAVSLAACFRGAFFVATPEAIMAAGQGLLFAFTYLWVAYNSLMNTDGRGIGWFSLFVAITVLPIFYWEWQAATTVGMQWLALNWLAWAVLWFSFFLLGALQKNSLVRPVAYLAILQGIATAWVPGFLLLMQRFPA